MNDEDYIKRQKEIIKEHIKYEHKQFLIEYDNLCKKYKMGLKGCGCCGSPSLNGLENINYSYTKNEVTIDDTFEGTVTEYLKWLEGD